MLLGWYREGGVDRQAEQDCARQTDFVLHVRKVLVKVLYVLYSREYLAHDLATEHDDRGVLCTPTSGTVSRNGVLSVVAL